MRNIVCPYLCDILLMMESIINKKARFDYEILETFNAGIVLRGHEVKAIKSGKASLVGAYAKIYNNELWLVGATISPYQENNTPQGYDPSATRKLLLTQEEIKTLTGSLQEKRLTLVPLKLYVFHGKIKIELGLARGKKAFDKRETIKKRDVERSMKRALS